MIKNILALTMVAGSCFAGDFLKENVVKLGPTDFYVNMWTDDSVGQTIKTMGLTNLHALYIDSHGGAGAGGFGYTIFPHESRTKKFLRYSIGDVAKILGNDATNIHNFYLGACNVEGNFVPSFIFKHFPNVTNITYVKNAKAFNATFIPAIICTNNSSKITKNEDGESMKPLISELYVKGKKKPYLTKIAGRETLHPTYQPVMGDFRNLLVAKQK